jgi:O-6-methylguanine DNA methyltransferase
MNLTLSLVPSPVGEILLVTDDAGVVRALDFEEYEDRMHRLLGAQYKDFTLRHGAAPAAVAEALDRYFKGDASALNEIPAISAGTKFQEEVWAAMRQIPQGATRTYGEIARDLGYTDWSSPRAVGAAVGSNPIAIIGPCHRVVGKSGALTGYAGGLERKQWLLEHEGAIFQPLKTGNKAKSEATPQQQLALEVPA